MSFADLGLSDEVLRAVSDAGYTEPTPIQQQAIPVVLMGRDILGCAQTGTGKTAGFTLPMIDILASGQAKARMPRSLILEPTRELAAQVAESFETYGKYHKLTKALLIGGHTMGDQIKVIDRGVDVLIATPGRLLDLFERGHLLMHDVRILVIDESDRMLDMGFIPDVEKIVGLLPKMRNTLFFSATMPPEIRRLADKFLMNPKEISVSPPATAAETVVQSMVVVKHGDGRRPGGGQKEKRAMLRQLIRLEKPRNALIFCNRKRDVDVVCRSLKRHGVEHADRLHGDMAQPARTETLERFRTGDIKLLVCSDVAARGLDIPAMSHVFNFDVPTHAEDYIHRIGRTGRAGLQGRAITIATPEDGRYVADIERLTGVKIERIELHGQAGPALEEAAERPARRRRGGRNRSRADRPAPEKNASEASRGRDRAKGRRRTPKPAAQTGGRGKDSSGGRGKDSPDRQGRDAKPEVRDQSEAAKQTPKQTRAPDPKRDQKQDQSRGRGQQGRATGAQDKSRDKGRDRGGDRGGRGKGDGGRGKGETVKGLGSHMPAFLRTTPPKGDKS